VDFKLTAILLLARKLMTPINSNNPVIEEIPLERALGMNAYLVSQLKNECDARGRSSSKTNEMEWIMVAIGVALLVIESIFFLAAFIASSPVCAQIGLYLIPPSVISFSLIPLFNPTDFEQVKGLIDQDLIEFAEQEDRSDLGIAHQGRIQLTPDNIPIYHEVKRLVGLRKEEEAKNKQS